jgi:hypothetical protein
LFKRRKRIKDGLGRRAQPCRWRSGRAVLCIILGAFGLSGASSRAQSSAAWEWQVGPACRFDARVSPRWNAASVVNRVSDQFLHTVSAPPNVGTLTGYADRDYTDGFVHTDPGTADPDTDTAGKTWNWGYDNASQYSGSSVQFHSAAGSDHLIAAQAASDELGGKDSDMPGLDFLIGRRLWARKGMALGFSAGASWFPEHSSSFSVNRTVARDTLTSFRYVDTYGAPYTPFPGDPYVGTIGGPGYLLGNIPDSRITEILSQNTTDWVADSKLKVEMQMAELRLGPTLWLMPTERLTLRLSPHLRVAYVETEAESHTQISPTTLGPITYDDRTHSRNWLLGGGAEAEARLALNRGWFVGFSTAYDWWDDNVNISADPFNASVDLGRVTCTATIGREF